MLLLVNLVDSLETYAFVLKETVTNIIVNIFSSQLGLYFSIMFLLSFIAVFILWLVRGFKL